MSGLTISQLARLAGVPVATIRFYERTGLIAAPPRRVSGYRQYSNATVKLLRFIRHAKELGFTLHEIKQLCVLTQCGDTDVNQIKAAVTTRLATVDEQLAELTQIRQKLEALAELCPGSGPPDACPIVAALEKQ